MDSRFKNLGILLAVIVVLVLGYFFVLPLMVKKTVSFDEGLSELNSLLQKNGLNFSPLAADVKGKDLTALKNELNSFKNSLNLSSAEGKALSLTTEVVLLKLEVAEQSNAVKENTAKFDVTEFSTDEQVCSKLSFLEKAVQAEEKLVFAQKSFEAKLNELKSSNPQEFSKLNVSESTLSIANLESKNSESKKQVESFKTECKNLKV